MYVVLWICLLTFITKASGQCSGTTSKSTVGYTAVSVNSPNYDNGYAKNLACSWQHSTSVPGSYLLLQINATVNCIGDDFTIYDGTDNTGSILHSCTSATPRYVVSVTGSIYTSFTTDSTTSAAERGFEYNTISGRDFSGSKKSCTPSFTPPCGTVTLLATTTQAFISTPCFPYTTYPQNSECTWKIERSGNTDPMELSFNFIDIEYEQSGPCLYDNVKITDDATGTTVLTTCGDNEWFPTQKYTTKGNVTIQFKSDISQHQRGFLLAYYIQDSSTSESDTSCLFDNCVILPILITVCGIVLIAMVTGIIMCVVCKAYVVRRRGESEDDNEVMSERSNVLRKKASLKRVIIPLINRNRVGPKSSKSVFGDEDDDIIMSKPPLETLPLHNKHIAEPKTRQKSEESKVKNSAESSPKQYKSNADDKALELQRKVEVLRSSLTMSKKTYDERNNEPPKDQRDNIKDKTTKIISRNVKFENTIRNKKQQESKATLQNVHELHAKKPTRTTNNNKNNYDTNIDMLSNTSQKADVLKATNSKKLEDEKLNKVLTGQTSDKKVNSTLNFPIMDQFTNAGSENKKSLDAGKVSNPTSKKGNQATDPNSTSFKTQGIRVKTKPVTIQSVEMTNNLQSKTKHKIEKSTFRGNKGLQLLPKLKDATETTVTKLTDATETTVTKPTGKYNKSQPVALPDNIKSSNSSSAPVGSSNGFKTGIRNDIPPVKSVNANPQVITKRIDNSPPKSIKRITPKTNNTSKLLDSPSDVPSVDDKFTTKTTKKIGNAQSHFKPVKIKFNPKGASSLKTTS